MYKVIKVYNFINDYIRSNDIDDLNDTCNSIILCKIFIVICNNTINYL